jgi:tRNA A-37 threonylcarbamoyl transferase component Bud32
MDSRLVEIRQEDRLGPDDEERLNVLFECNEKLFNVVLSDRTLPGFDGPNSIERGYLKRLDDCAWDGYAEDEPPDAHLKYSIIWGEIEDITHTLCQPIFRERAPAIKDRPLRKDLHAYMHPEVFNFRLVTLRGEPTLIERDDVDPLILYPPLPGTTPISPNIPRFPSSSIEVVEKLECSWVLKVLLNGQVMCCKLAHRAAPEALSLEYEYRALQQILDAGLTPLPRVPRLKGVVESKEGAVVGILMEYINKALPNLEDALSKDDAIEKSRRAKWATQIEDTLKQLHAIGVVWGDAKTSNVLIDEKDDAWIVDFGGGQTFGWVDYELVGTKDGDLQALKKILEALHA